MDNLDYYKEEEDLCRKLFNLEEVLEFTRTHRVEVMLQSDLQMHCYVDYKEGDGSYAATLSNPLLAIVLATRKYKEYGEKRRS